MTRTIPRRAAAASAVVGIAIAAAIGGAAAPAAAASYDIEGSPAMWQFFNDTTGAISDGYFDYDLAGELYGWTGDAFDGMGIVNVTDCSAGTGTSSPLFTNAAPPVIVAGGTTVFTLTGTDNVDPLNCLPYTIDATVTFQGSFVRWAFTLTGDFNDFSFEGDLGSDGAGVFTQPDPSTILESDTDTSDPSLAFQASTSGVGAWNIPANISNVEYVASGSPATVTVVIAIADYTSLTGQAAADAHLASIASTLSTTSFGTSFPLFQGTDAPDFAAQSFTTGSAANAVATYTFDPGLYYGLNYFDNSTTGNTVDARVGTLPAGLAAAVSFAPGTGAPIITITGTPTVAGTFSVPVTFVQESTGTPFSPLFSSLSITVSAGATLPAAGTDSVISLAGGAGLLMAGLATVFVTTRRRAAQAR